MNDAPDPLEIELSALRPCEVSPRLRRRVAERLVDASPRRFPPVWRLALAGGLAAACLAAAIILWRQSGRDVRPEPIVVRDVLPLAEEKVEPTLLDYQCALARSPEELEALIDREAHSAAEANPEQMRIHSFNWSNAELHELLGDD
ncbi:MAG: hypothetical protein ACJ8FY_14550 [Gemmataceae bacterium]